MGSKLIIISGQRGVGKSTLVASLVSKLPRVRRMVSHTTRKPRPGESNGTDYHFVTSDVFETMRKRSEFLFHRSLGPTQMSGIARSELFESDTSIIDIAGPIARLMRDEIVGKGYGETFTVYIHASRSVRHQRVLRRDQRLSEADAIRLLREDLDDGNVSRYADFDLCVQNNLDRTAKTEGLLDAVFVPVTGFLAK